MNKGRLLAAVLGVATIALVVIGTLWPSAAALAWAGGGTLITSSSTPEAAVKNLGNEIRARAWQKGYDSLANKAEFTEPQFEHDVTGYYPSLLSYTTLDNFEIRTVHSGDTESDVELKLRWATVVGPSVTTRIVHLVRNGSAWQAEWPLKKPATVPPQVIPVNYLRWDVIYRGPGDEWGVQDVEAPHEIGRAHV